MAVHSRLMQPQAHSPITKASPLRWAPRGPQARAETAGTPPKAHAQAWPRPPPEQRRPWPVSCTALGRT
eukprot:5625714-Alexandrium_andersonii.AAC.1